MCEQQSAFVKVRLHSIWFDGWNKAPSEAETAWIQSSVMAEVILYCNKVI